MLFSPVLSTIFVLRYFGIFPYVLKNSNSNFGYNELINRKVFNKQKLLLNPFLYFYSLSIIFISIVFIFNGNVIEFINTDVKFVKIEEFSFSIFLAVTSGLSILMLIDIVMNMKRLKYFINDNMMFFSPLEIKINWIFIICVVFLAGFPIELLIRQLVRLYEGETEIIDVIYILIFTYNDIVFNYGYIVFFYSITFCLSKNWEILRSSTYSKSDIPNLDFIIKITKKLVKCQNKCNDLFTIAISICLLMNILFMIFFTFLNIVDFTNVNDVFARTKYTILSLLLTTLICDVSEKLNKRVR